MADDLEALRNILELFGDIVAEVTKTATAIRAAVRVRLVYLLCRTAKTRGKSRKQLLRLVQRHWDKRYVRLAQFATFKCSPPCEHLVRVHTMSSRHLGHADAGLE